MEKVLRIMRFDLSTCWKSIIALFVFYFIFGLYYGFAVGDLRVIPISVVIWISMVAGSPFVVREKFFLNHLLGTLPVNRKNIIRSGYLLSILIGVFGITMSEIMVIISTAFFHIGFDRKDMYLTLCIAVILYSLILAVQLPLYFHLKHSTIVLMLPTFLFLSYAILCQLYYFGVFHICLVEMIAVFWRYFYLSVTVTVLLAATLFYLSYIVTCRLYRDKDL